MGESLDDNIKKKLDKQCSPANCSNSDPKKERKRKEVAIFGNYRNYNGYRVGQELDGDPRLTVIKKEWFEGNDCLDIDCNSDFITLTIARKFSCCSILGVDIWCVLQNRKSLGTSSSNYSSLPARINDAHWTLTKVTKRSCNMQSITDKLVKGEKVNQS